MKQTWLVHKNWTPGQIMSLTFPSEKPAKKKKLLKSWAKHLSWGLSQSSSGNTWYLFLLPPPFLLLKLVFIPSPPFPSGSACRHEGPSWTLVSFWFHGLHWKVYRLEELAVCIVGEGMMCWSSGQKCIALLASGLKPLNYFLAGKWNQLWH